MNIQDIMTDSCEYGLRNMTVAEAAQKMRDQDFGFLPVACKQEDKLVGTVTDRDIAIRCVAEGKDPASTTINDIMSEKLYYCFNDQDVKEVCDNMGDIRVRRLPVVNRDKRLVGVVSFGDVAQAAQESEIGQTQKQFTRECANNERMAA